MVHLGSTASRSMYTVMRRAFTSVSIMMVSVRHWSESVRSEGSDDRRIIVDMTDDVVQSRLSSDTRRA